MRRCPGSVPVSCTSQFIISRQRRNQAAQRDGLEGVRDARRAASARGFPHLSGGETTLATLSPGHGDTTFARESPPVPRPPSRGLKFVGASYTSAWRRRGGGDDRSENWRGAAPLRERRTPRRVKNPEAWKGARPGAAPPPTPPLSTQRCLVLFIFLLICFFVRFSSQLPAL